MPRGKNNAYNGKRNENSSFDYGLILMTNNKKHFSDFELKQLLREVETRQLTDKEIDILRKIGIKIKTEKELIKVSGIKDIKNIKTSNKSELSKVVAEKLAKKAKEKKISKIYFDRGIYKYHGRIKVFAETLRKNGMEF